MESIGAIWFLAFGALFILGSIALVGFKAYQRRHWRKTRGVVTGNAETTNRRNRTLLTPVVEFTARDGKRIHFASAVATSWQSYRPGDPVRVIYDPAFPDHAEIASFARLWLTPLTFVAIGIALVSVGAYVFRDA